MRRYHKASKYTKFNEQTGIRLDAGADTAFCIDDWKGVSPICEIVTAEFDAMDVSSEVLAPVHISPMPQEQLSLFAMAAE